MDHLFLLAFATYQILKCDSKAASPSTCYTPGLPCLSRLLEPSTPSQGPQRSTHSQLRCSYLGASLCPCGHGHIFKDTIHLFPQSLRAAVLPSSLPATGCNLFLVFPPSLCLSGLSCSSCSQIPPKESSPFSELPAPSLP